MQDATRCWLVTTRPVGETNDPDPAPLFRRTVARRRLSANSGVTVSGYFGFAAVPEAPTAAGGFVRSLGNWFQRQIPSSARAAVKMEQITASVAPAARTV